MASREVRQEVHRVRDFAIPRRVEDILAARGSHPIGELRFAPTDVQRCHHVVEEVRGDAPGVVPVLSEAEEAVGVPLALLRGTQPHVPVDVVDALAVGPGIGLDHPAAAALGCPVPLSPQGVSVVGPLARNQLADHAVLNGLARLPPLVGRRGLGTDLQHGSGLAHLPRDRLGLLDGVGHRLLEVHIYPGIHGVDRHGPVPVVGGCDHDSVDVWTGQNLPVVQRGELGLAVLLGQAPPLLVDVADCRYAEVLPSLDHRQHQPLQAAAATSDADLGDVDAVVGPNHAVRRSRVLRPGRRGGQGPPGDCGRVQELSTVDFGSLRHGLSSPNCISDGPSREIRRCATIRPVPGRS